MEKINIVIADDEQLFRSGIRFILEREPNFNISFEAENGKKLLDFLRTTKEFPDIILMDLNIETQRQKSDFILFLNGKIGNVSESIVPVCEFIEFDIWFIFDRTKTKSMSVFLLYRSFMYTVPDILLLSWSTILTYVLSKYFK